MVKDTFSFRNKQKKPWFTETVRRIVIWDIVIFFLLFVISNIFTIAITNKILDDNLDNEIKRKVDILDDLFVFEGDSIKFIGLGEINEPAFVSMSPNSLFLQVYDRKGNLFLKSENIKSLGLIPFDLKNHGTEFEFENETFNNRQMRVGYAQVRDKEHEIKAYIQLAAFETENHFIMNEIVVFNILLLPVILFLIVVVSIFLAKKSYAPLNKIIAIAENTTANNLNTKIEYKADPNDELGRLRDTLNHLFMRLQEQVNQISQFTDNASHQLMNPLTALKTELEYILKRSRTQEEYKESLTVLNSQTDKMINIVKSLLTIAKYSGNPELYKNVFKIKPVIDEIIKPLFKNNNNIIYEIEDDLYLRGSQEGFRIILENLIDNAVKYTPENGSVQLKISKLSDQTEIIVTDNGIGIMEEEKEKIFERFYRSLNTKQNVNGYGLGLCLVKTITLAMNGSIKIENNIPTGTKFIIRFPAMSME